MPGQEVDLVSFQKFTFTFIAKHKIPLDPNVLLTNSLSIARDGYVSGWTNEREEFLEKGLKRLVDEFGLNAQVVAELRRACEELGQSGEIKGY